MRCKKHHPSDPSSGVGVCATCLRERLAALIAAQAQAQAQAQQAQLAQRATPIDDLRKSDPPPPLLFPRSVSPYVTRRKSDDADAAAWPQHSQFDHRFYSTPQVGPTYNSAAASNFSNSRSYKKKPSKFSVFSSIFRSRSDKSSSDPRVSCDPTTSSSSPWFSTIFPPRRKKQSRLFSLEDAAAGGRRGDRGMSPERGEDLYDDCDRSPSGSGCSSESSKRTPAVAPPSVRRTRTAHGRNVSGLAFCLSPLVRPSPNRQWNQKAGLPPDSAFSGEIRGSVKPHLATAASFCANRSRKLADFGRFNHNR